MADRTRTQASEPTQGRRVLLGAAGLVAGLAFAIGAPALGLCTGLSIEAVHALGILIACIVWWVAGVLPEFVIALGMCAAFACLCDVPTTIAFSAFASSTWWLLVAAFALGFGMQHSGLMARMAHAILRIFPRTFRMQAAGLIACGTLIGPFIPSLSAKATMLAPLSMGISDALGYERGGRRATGLFLAMFTGIRTVGPAVISASIIGYGLLATLPPETAAQFDMVRWFASMLPWFAFVMVANYIALVAMFGHEREDTRTSQDDRVREPDAGGHPERSALSAPERRMAVIMALCIVLWATESLHAVPAHIVSIGAMVAMLACGVVDAKELCRSLAWDSLVFIGCVLGLAEVFAALGIDAWIVGACEAPFAALAANPYLLVVGICIMTIALRFVIVSEMAFINIFMAFMVPLALSFGISPWVIGVCVYAVVNPWFVLYQNPIYLSAYYATGERMAKQSASALYCGVYLLICIAGLLVSVPLWQLLGLM